MFSTCRSATALLSSVSLLLSATGVAADEKTFLQNTKYNEGEFGKYVTQSFITSTIEPPRINFMQPFSNCDDGSYLFIAPRGEIAYSSFFVMDHDGSMIWGPDHRFGEVYNFQVQHYKGEPYLTFWAGDDSVGGHGEGKYYMLDQHYQEHRTISAGSGIRGDLHAFYITPENTAIYTAYERAMVDLSGLRRPGESWVWESLFQELDIDTHEVLFQWRASDFFDFRDSYSGLGQASANSPWDYFHINMVEKDKFGNYLVSTRYGRCILYIAGRDAEKPGSILWQLGGKKNSFTDLSDGAATTFVGQHDAHWVDDDEGNHLAITLFDNRGDWFYKIENKSRGMRIKVDLQAMTAEVERSIVHPHEILSTSQGSYQTLPNGNIVLGYGFNGVMTEFDPEGNALCDMYFEPAKDFNSGNVQSYRNLKFNWTGIPLTTPDIAYHGDSIYMSWLGSTKLRSWLLQDCDEADGMFESIQAVPKSGFETRFVLAEGRRMRRYVRAVAVNQGGTQLATSHLVDLVDPSEIWGEMSPEELQQDQISHDTTGHESLYDGDDSAAMPAGGSVDVDADDEWDYEEDVEDSHILFVLGVCAMVSAVLVAWMSFGRRYAPFAAWIGNGSGGASNGEKIYGDGSVVSRLFTRMRAYIPAGASSSMRQWTDSAQHSSLLRDQEMGQDGHR